VRRRIGLLGGLKKEWDYKFNGLKISHKVSEKTGPIAAIWDATKKGVTTWSFDEPITYVLASSQPPTRTTVTLPEDLVPATER